MTYQNSREENANTAKAPEQTILHTQRKRQTLEVLLKSIPEGARMEEIDWGSPRGAEFW
jgi:antitoxin component of MazEF toxin-antitoxin module